MDSLDGIGRSIRIHNTGGEKRSLLRKIASGPPDDAVCLGWDWTPDGEWCAYPHCRRGFVRGPNKLSNRIEQCRTVQNRAEQSRTEHGTEQNRTEQDVTIETHGWQTTSAPELESIDPQAPKSLSMQTTYMPTDACIMHAYLHCYKTRIFLTKKNAF
jgi:hypothetical protein